MQRGSFASFQSRMVMTKKSSLRLLKEPPVWRGFLTHGVTKFGTGALVVLSPLKSRVSAKRWNEKTDWIRAMSYRNFGFASRDLKVYSFRRTRTFIARLLITCGNRFADLAEAIAPWLRESR